MLADSSCVLCAPLVEFSGLLRVPCVAEKLQSRGTHQIVVSIVPPARLDAELSRRLLEFFEAEFNDEFAGAISGAIAGSTIFMLSCVRTPARPAGVASSGAAPSGAAPTIIGALTARLGSFGLYTSYLLTRPGVPSQQLFPHLGTKPWQRRGIGGFLVSLAGAPESE